MMNGPIFKHFYQARQEALYQTKSKSSQDPLNYPIRLNNKLAALAGVSDGVNAPPTAQAEAVYRDLIGRIGAQLDTLRTLLGPDLDDFNRVVRDQGIPAVVIKNAKPKEAASPTPVP